MSLIEIIVILLFVTRHHKVSSFICPNPYQYKANFCMHHFETTADHVKSVIDKCHAKKGRLPTNEEALFYREHFMIDKSIDIFVAISDILEEKNTIETGWRDFNGKLVTINNWDPGDIKNLDNTQDCVILLSKLRDCNCKSKYDIAVICTFEPAYEHKLQTTIFKKVPLENKFNFDNSGVDIFEEIVAISRIKCSVECSNRKPKCKGLFYDKKSKRCVLSNFILSTLPTSYKQTGVEWIWVSDVMN